MNLGTAVLPAGRRCATCTEHFDKLSAGSVEVADSVAVLPDAQQMPGAAAAAGMGGVLADIIRGENGRLRSLIKLLDEGEGQGYAAWLVLPSPEAWQEVMQVGLKMKEIGF